MSAVWQILSEKLDELSIELSNYEDRRSEAEMNMLEAQKEFYRYNEFVVSTENAILELEEALKEYE